MADFFSRRCWAGACAVLFLTAAAAVQLRAQNAAPIVVKTAEFPRPATVPLGINLEPVLDFSRSMMFVDLIKAARKFGSADAPWDEKAPVDADGWPTGDAGTVVVADAPVPPGNYLFSCTGRCEPVVVNSKATFKGVSYDRAANTMTATLSVDPGANNLYIAFKSTAGGVKNIRLLRPGYKRGGAEVFNKDFLKAIEPFTTLRLMEFSRTNQSDVSAWADRPKLTDALQSSARGAAWEYAIQLANETGKDLWINIPARASDDYVKQLAELFKSKLNKDRVVYVEYSNEVWNSIFPQFRYNLDQAQAEVAAGHSPLNDGGQDTNKYYWAWKRVAERLVEISNIFKAVDGAAAINTTIRPVLASQSAQPLMLRKQVEFIAKNYGPPNRFIYGVAGAPYIGPAAKVADRSDATAAELLDSASTSGMQWIKEAALKYQTIARYYRLHSLCYEGGPGFDNPHCVAAEIAANRDPRIGALIQNYLDAWYATGGGLFMYFNLASTYGKYGSWGLTEDIRQATPKTRIIRKIAAAPAPEVTAGFSVPGAIQACDFNIHDGGGTENSGDGGKNLAFLKPGNWFDYLLNVSAPGDYVLTVQTASGRSGSQIEVLMSGQSLGTVAGPNTGDWHKWGNTQPLLLRLEQGQVVLRLRIAKPGLNIRSITFEKSAEKSDGKGLK